jgi:hypothetical protein
MRRHRQGAAVVSHKDAVTALLVPPINLVLPSYRLKIRDLPIQRIAPHSCEKLGCRVHRRDTTRETAPPLLEGLFALPNVELTGRQRCDALAARRMMNQNCIAASVARRWRSG